MSDYVLILFDEARPDGARPIQRRLQRDDWRLSGEGRGFRLLTTGARRLPLVSVPGQHAFIIGDLFGAPRLEAGATPADTCKALLSTAWGRYVVVFADGEGGLRGVFRDPSCTVDVVAWRGADYAVVASEFPQALRDLVPGLSIDWSRVGAGLVDPLALASGCGITGLETATPGALRTFGPAGSSETQLWRPDHFARKARRDDAEARAELVAVIDDCIAALCGLGGEVIAELSGGLDSSIVAAALSRAAAAKVVQWLHFHIDDPAGDERLYARAMARRLGVTLTEARKPPGRLDLEALAAVAFGAKPSWRVVDGAYDQDLATRAARLGAKRIMTGLGGDTVFMQGGDPWLAGEAIAAGRWDLLPRIARHAQRSVWGVARRAALEAAGRQPPLTPPAPAWLAPAAHVAARATPGHPWLAELGGVSAPKRQQIAGLAHTLMIHGRSRRTAVADVVSPLMSQPVMELCLSLSAIAQTGGGDDRAMARAAFADRLAPEVAARRSKAGYGAYYGRMVSQDLPVLRDLLLGGVILGSGLVDAAGLDALLSPETLIRQGPYREILNLVILELWARSWGEAAASDRSLSERVESRA